MPSADSFKRNNELSPTCGAVYFHVPFCVRKCHYCDFYSRPLDAAVCESYLNAAEEEFRRYRRDENPLTSLYVGGGTPTSLGEKLLDRALGIFSPCLGDGTEFTVEANPGTLSEPIVEVLVRRKVNRVSLGVQSFDPAILATLGRIHGVNEIPRSVEMLRLAGIANVSIDLIFAVPGQSIDSWRGTLSSAIDLGVEHISCYALSVEDGTPLAEAVEQGRLTEQDQDAHRRMYDLAVDMLSAAGLGRYEISNFCSPGRQCKHNLVYWRNEQYIGIGPGAASFDGATRSKNLPDLDAYIAAIADGRDPPRESEHLEGKAAMAETVMLGLRLEQGIDRRSFQNRYGLDIADAFPRTMEKFTASGRIICDSKSIRLSPNSFFVANSILTDFFVEADA